MFIGCFLLLAILARVPITYSLGWASVAVFAYKSLPYLNIAQASFSTMNSFTFMAFPFFLLAGTLMEHSGISEQLIRMVDAFVGKIRGSMGLVTILSCAAFGTLTGSAWATMSAIGKIMIPELDRRGYSREYTSAMLSSTCFLGFLIPPSGIGIIYGVISGVKITDIWIATIGPAFLFIIGYGIVNYVIRRKIETKVVADAGSGTAVIEKFNFANYITNAGVCTAKAIPALIMPIIIFGGIYGGVFTATEAGAVSCAYGTIYYLIKKVFKRGGLTSNMSKIYIGSAALTGMVAILVIFSMIATRAVTLSGASNAVTDFIISNVTSPTQFLIMVYILLIILGMIIDTTSSVLLVTPLLMPSVLALGIDPIHFGSFMIITLCVGYMTPPFASGIFFATKLTSTTFIGTLKECVPFLVVAFAVSIITMFYSPLSTFLIG